jgi:hypothetical protein
MHTRLTIALGLAVATAAITATGLAQTTDSHSAASFFQREIAPILEEKCAVCHLTGQEAGNISLVADNAVASLVGVNAVGAPNVKRVVPGEPEASYLISKLEGTHGEVGGLGGQMPFGGPPLSIVEIAKIRRWVKDGAKP